jgi:imidazolonepropionase-like amidohydrolase
MNLPLQRVNADQVIQITETRSAEDCYYTDEETAACVDEAHKHGKRLCAHARARDSVKMCMCATHCWSDRTTNRDQASVTA